MKSKEKGRGRVLVTGGAGYVGSVLVPYLLEKGYKVNCFDTFWFWDSTDEFLKAIKAEKNPNLVLVKGDLRNKADVKKSLKGVDQVIHLACLSNDPSAELDKEFTHDVNYNGSINMIDMAKQAGVKRFIYASSCHDSKTKLVTKRGLVHYKDIKKNDKVFTLNKEGVLEENPINEILIFKHDAKLIKAKGKRLDFAVTPNHKIWYLSSRGNLNIKACGKIKNIKKNSYVELFDSKGHIGSKKLDKYGPFSIDDFFFLAGMFIGDGCIVYTHNKGMSRSGLTREEHLKVRDRNGRFKKTKSDPKPYSYPYNYIRFTSLRMSRSWGPFISLLQKYNINFTTDSGKYINIRSRGELDRLFKQFGRGAYNKNIPCWMLDYPKKTLKRLFDGLMLTDGCKRGRTYFTSSSKLKDGFVELCFKIGYIPSVVRRKTISNYQTRVIESKNNYVINISKVSRRLFGHHFKTSHYKGDVWCLNVPNGNFLVERNGKYTFLGNSSVYGVRDEPDVTEDLEPEPITQYSELKVEIEKYLLKNLDDDFKGVILRPSTICGYSPRLRLDVVVHILTNFAVNKGKIRVFGGEQLRPLIHIKDMVRVYELLLEVPIDKINKKTYNAGYGNLKVIEIAKLVKEVVGDIPINIEPTDDPRSYHVNSDKIKKELGFEVEHTIKESIQELKELFNKGKIKDLDSDRYYNIKRMKRFLEENE